LSEVSAGRVDTSFLYFSFSEEGRVREYFGGRCFRNWCLRFDVQSSGVDGLSFLPLPAFSPKDSFEIDPETDYSLGSVFPVGIPPQLIPFLPELENLTVLAILASCFPQGMAFSFLGCCMVDSEATLLLWRSTLVDYLSELFMIRVPSFPPKCGPELCFLFLSRSRDRFVFPLGS